MRPQKNTDETTRFKSGKTRTRRLQKALQQPLLHSRISDDAFLRLLLLLSRTAAFLVLIITGAVFLGWILNEPALKSIHPALPSMKANASIALGSLAMAVLLSTSRWQGGLLQHGFSFLAFLIGLLTISQYIFGVHIGIDELFFQEPAGEVGTTSPGRMAPNTAMLLMIFGLAMLFLGKKHLGRHMNNIFLFLAAFVLTPTVIGYLYNIDFIFGLATYTKMAVHTAVAFLLLLAAIPLSRGSEGFMAIMTSNTSGGFLARRLLLLAVTLPLLLGWLILAGHRAGWYDTQYQFLMLVVLYVFIFTYVIWKNVYALHVLDNERRKIAATLIQREERFRTLIEQSSDAIQLVDPKGKILYTSESIRNVLGFTPEELKGQRVPPFIHQKDLPIFTRAVRELLKEPGKQLTVEYRVKHKDGSWAWIEVTGVNHLKTPNIKALVGTFRNITRRKELERQKDAFIGVVSHELKTPVTSIKAFTQVLERRFAKIGDGASTQLLGKMDTQLDKLTALIGDLLDVTKIEGGKLQFNEVNFSFDELVHDIVEEIQRTTSKHTIRVEGKTKQTIVGDRDRIGQVIINLLTNAIKYSSDANDIILKTSATAKNVTLCVTDYGVGIPKEKQAHIFERFYRVSDKTLDTIPGMGLGLFISSEIIKRQKGKIWVESTEGKGSTFCFTLPIEKK